ncbi:hypothetical protein H632_c3963p0, partial [Helicosporidium sp. ATCC 50920]
GSVAQAQARALAKVPAAQHMTALLRARDDRAASRTHAETSMAVARALGRGNEYRRWTMCLAQCLAEQGMDRALGELCEDLVKDMAWGAGAASSLGLSPRGMLEEIAGALASSRRQPSLLAQLRETLRGSSFLSTS